MSNRVTLTNEDVNLIVAALRVLHDTSIITPKSYPVYALASKQRMNEVGRKLGVNEVRR